MNFEEVKSNLLTNKHTRVFHETKEDMRFNAPHHFYVQNNKGEILSNVDFQEGPIEEVGVNGVSNEDLIAMVICRLEHFNQSRFKCRENAIAITKLEEALLWLKERTIGRGARGVEGFHVK